MARSAPPAAASRVFGIGGLGTLGGALLANRVAARVGLGRTIIVSVALDGPAMLLLALAPRDAPVAWLVASVALGGFAVAVYNINQVSQRPRMLVEAGARPGGGRHRGRSRGRTPVPAGDVARAARGLGALARRRR